jgi:hypothetical protein
LEIEIRSTRLRFIAAKQAEVVSALVSSLPFKVELKGNPVRSDDGYWYSWFVIPDIVPVFNNYTVEAVI